MPEPQDIAALREALNAADSILSLLAHRGLVDSEMNREDVKQASDMLASLRPRGGTAGSALLSDLDAERERGRALRAAVEALAEEWAACWCGPQQGPEDDPRVRDCPQHGSDDCRHMAEGIVVHLRALLAAHVPSPLLDGGAGEGDR